MVSSNDEMHANLNNNCMLKKKAQVCLPITYHTSHKIEKYALNMVIKPWTFLFSRLFFSPFQSKQHPRIWKPNLTFVNIYKSTSPFLDLIITLQMKLRHSTFANEITNFPNEIQMLKIIFNLSKSHFKFCKWDLTFSYDIQLYQMNPHPSKKTFRSCKWNLNFYK